MFTVGGTSGGNNHTTLKGSKTMNDSKKRGMFFVIFVSNRVDFRQETDLFFFSSCVHMNFSSRLTELK